MYVTRLAVRVEGYLLFLTRNKKFHDLQDQSSENIYNGAYIESDVRGLKCSDDVIEEALGCQKQIRILLEDKIFKIIARWIKKSKKDGKFGQACMLHAHLAYLHRNVDPEELTPRIVFSVLASQVFLFSYYKYDLEFDQKDMNKKKSRMENEDINGKIFHALVCAYLLTLLPNLLIVVFKFHILLSVNCKTNYGTPINFQN